MIESPQALLLMGFLGLQRSVGFNIFAMAVPTPLTYKTAKVSINAAESRKPLAIL